MARAVTVTVKEHSSSSYAPRTFANARSADVTLAFATDFTTAGEKLTHKAAGTKYHALELQPFREVNDDYAVETARDVWRFVVKHDARTLNIAGNGIYTLAKYGWTQKAINRYITAVLRLIHTHWGIERLHTGGQTGVDLAGAVAGKVLGIETHVLMPKGCLMRNADGKDNRHTPDQVKALIEKYAGALR